VVRCAAARLRISVRHHQPREADPHHGDRNGIGGDLLSEIADELTAPAIARPLHQLVDDLARRNAGAQFIAGPLEFRAGLFGFACELGGIGHGAVLIWLLATSASRCNWSSVRLGTSFSAFSRLRPASSSRAPISRVPPPTINAAQCGWMPALIRAVTAAPSRMT